jgi:hypothetical protein
LPEVVAKLPTAEMATDEGAVVVVVEGTVVVVGLVVVVVGVVVVVVEGTVVVGVVVVVVEGTVVVGVVVVVEVLGGELEGVMSTATPPEIPAGFWVAVGCTAEETSVS